MTGADAGTQALSDCSWHAVGCGGYPDHRMHESETEEQIGLTPWVEGGSSIDEWSIRLGFALDK